MHAWVWLALAALVAWTVQRLLAKLALADLGTSKFYLLSAAVSLATYAPYLALRPPRWDELAPAFALAGLMALTFWVTTEAIRRGPLGAVSPITALSPALTGLLAVALLHERPGWPAYLGILLAAAGVSLLATPARAGEAAGSWRILALLSLVLQGAGAFLAKLVVTPAGPSALLLAGAAVQVAVGLVLAPPSRWSRSDLLRRPALFTAAGYAVGAAATIGYLSALAMGPASVVVPLVATSPALAGALAVLVLREEASWRRLAGIAVALAGAVLLSVFA